MTETQRAEMARARAKKIVQQLRKSNERTARSGGPVVEESGYRELEETLAKKLVRAKAGSS